jgi:hypothetical protein
MINVTSLVEKIPPIVSNSRYLQRNLAHRLTAEEQRRSISSLKKSCDALLPACCSRAVKLLTRIGEPNSALATKAGFRTREIRHAGQGYRADLENAENNEPHEDRQLRQVRLH